MSFSNESISVEESKKGDDYCVACNIFNHHYKPFHRGPLPDCILCQLWSGLIDKKYSRFSRQMCSIKTVLGVRCKLIFLFTFSSKQFITKSKSIVVTSVEKDLLMHTVWRNTSTQFTKVTKTTNANLVANHFRNQDIWRNTSTQFMKATKITNVNLVVNHSLMQVIWRDTSTQFMKATKITNVDLVVNPPAQQQIWRHIFIEFMKAIKITHVIFVKNLLVHTPSKKYLLWKFHAHR